MRALTLVLGFALLAVVGLNAYKRGSLPESAFLRSSAKASAPLPQLWPIPEFKLTERDGRTVSLDDLKGSVWVADFFYTTCPGPCPMLTSRLGEVHKQLAGEPGVRIVSISSDPEKDTPEVLRKYAQHFGASERWLFLTGEKKAIFDLANSGFKLSLAETGNPEDPVTHSTKIALVDRNGIARGFYEGVGEGGTEKLLTDIRRLLSEKP